MSGAKKYLGLLGVITLLSVVFQPTAKAQSLQEFLQSTYDNHPELLYNAQTLYQQFEGSRASAIGGVLPSLTYSQSSTYTRRNFQNPSLSSTQTGGLTGNSRTDTQRLSLRQNLFSSFRDVNEFRGFLNTAAALELQYYNGEQGFLLQAIDAYLNVILSKNIVSVRLANFESLQERLDIVQRLYDIGDTTELDLQQSRAQLLSAQTEWERALGAYEGAVANFRRYGAIEPTDLVLADIPTNMPVSKEDGEQQVLAGNFLVRALELAEKASKLAYHAAQGERAGLSVDLSINYDNVFDRGNIRGGGSATAVNRSDQHDTTTSVSVSLPLYQPTASAIIRRAYQAYLQSKNNYLRQRLDVVRQFQSNWANFTRAAKAEEFQRQAAEAAQIALDNVVLQQRAGLRSIVEVLDEETRLINAQVTYERARYDHLISAYRVLESTGQLTAKDLGLQTKYGEQVADYFNSKKGFWEAPGAYTAIKGLFVEEE